MSKVPRKRQRQRQRDDNEANAASSIRASLWQSVELSLSHSHSLCLSPSFLLSLSQSVSQSFSQLVSFSSGNVNWIALLTELGNLNVWNDLTLCGKCGRRGGEEWKRVHPVKKTRHSNKTEGYEWKGRQRKEVKEECWSYGRREEIYGWINTYIARLIDG